MPAGWLEAGDSMVQAGLEAAAETNLEGSGLDPSGGRSWLRTGSPGAAEEQRRVELWRKRQGRVRDGPCRSQTGQRRGGRERKAPAQAPPQRIDWLPSLQGPSPAYQTPA